MTGSWQHSSRYNSRCKVIEEYTTFGQAVCRIWLPDDNTVVSVPRTDLQSAPPTATTTAHHITYVAAAAKVAAALEDTEVLLAPMVAPIIPLPHQMHAVATAMQGEPVRYLLADEVGLGKTIEAGLIMRELKLRRAVQRMIGISSSLMRRTA